MPSSVEIGVGSGMMALSGHAVVCCIHGREKRQVTEIDYDPRHQRAGTCACCENVFTIASGESLVCSTCFPVKEGSR